jgi:hypothetical protein
MNTWKVKKYTFEWLGDKLGNEGRKKDTPNIQ